jgi:hypothetical protein
VINGLTGLGIIATVIVVYFMTSEQNRISEQTLYATKKGMELADSSYVVQNRAYVLPQLPSVATMPDGTPAVSIPFVNYGKTPAYRFCMQIRYQLWDTIREDPKSYTYSWSKYEKTLAPQYPDTEYIPRDSVYWKVPGGKIFTYGKIWYIDFVGKQHFTTFAYFREFRRGKKFAIYPGYDSTEEY